MERTLAAGDNNNNSHAPHAHRLSLLNTTVSQLAKSVNRVLTIAYRDIYSQGSDDDIGQLQLLTSPMAATEEVLQMYSAGLIPVDLAMPAVLHAIGATKEDIDRAVRDAKNKEDEKRLSDSKYQEFTTKDRQLALEEREIALQKHNDKDRRPTTEKQASDSPEKYTSAD